MNPFRQILLDAKVLRIAVPFILGIVVGWLLRDYLHSYWYVVGLLCIPLCIALYVVGRKKQKLSSKSFGILLALTFVCIGCADVLFQYHAVDKKWNGQPSYYKCIVTTQPKVGEKVTRCEAQLLEQSKNGKWLKENIQIEVTLLNDSIHQTVNLGDALLLYGKMESPRNAGNPDEFDYASWQKRQGIVGNIFAANNYQKGSEKMRQELMASLSWWKKLKLSANQLQASLSRMYSQRGIGKSEKAILSALTLGDKYALTKDVRYLFSETGASHVLALSGLHLGILVSILLFLLTPLTRTLSRRWMAALVCIVFIWSFTLLTGMSTSLLRASLMYSLFLLFYAQNKQGIPLNNLSLAAIVILLVQPMSLMDIGFQLSFLSVFSILFFQQFYTLIRPQRKWLALIADFAYVAIVAQVATAPLVAYNFHVFPVAFLLSSVVVIPCAYLLLGGSLLFFVFYPWVFVSKAIGCGLAFLVHGMQFLLEKISLLPFSSLELYPSLLTTILAYVVVYELVQLWNRRNRNSMIETMIVIAILCATAIYHYSSRVEREIVFYNVPSCPSVHFISSSSESYLWLSKAEKKEKLYAVTRNFWKEKAINAPIEFVSNYNDKFLRSQNGIVQYGRKRIVLLNNNDWRNKTVKSPLKVDVMYISTGCYTSLNELSQLFQPQLLVLDASLSDYMHEKYLQEAKAMKWSCYDIKNQGALTLKCD